MVSYHLGAAIPSFHTDAFILKATLKAEFIEEHVAEEGSVDGETGRAAVAVNVAVNTKLLAERLGLSRKTIQRELNWLQERDIIRWVGADKNGHWELR